MFIARDRDTAIDYLVTDLNKRRLFDPVEQTALVSVLGLPVEITHETLSSFFTVTVTVTAAAARDTAGEDAGGEASPDM